MFKGGVEVGSGYTILKGAAEYVPTAYDGFVGQIVIDVEKTSDIRPDKFTDALRWLIDTLGLLITHILRLCSPSRSLAAKCTSEASYPTHCV